MNRWPLLTTCIGLIALVSIGGAVPHGSGGSSIADEVRLASEALAAFNFDRAVRLFTAAHDGLERADPLWERATLGLALSTQYLDPPTADRALRAERLFRELADAETSPRFTARARLSLGRLAELSDFRGDEPDPDAAIGHYRSVYERWPELPAAEEAVLRHAGVLAERFDDPASLDAAIQLVESWLATDADGTYASLMHEFIGTIALFRGDEREAIARFQRAEELGLSEPNLSARTWWLIARFSESRNDDPETAVAFYTRIVREAPYSGHAFEARLAIERLKSAFPEIDAPTPDLETFGIDVELDGDE